MRVLAALFLVAATPLAARADNIVELAGGLMTPISDDQWSDYAESGPKLAVRAGSVGDKVGGLLSLDWSPINTDDFGFGDAVDVSAHRFRIQAMAAVHHKAGKLLASFRGGAGIDIAHIAVDGNIFGVQFEDSDSDIGIAVEVAGGLWFQAGSVEVGGELALPMAFHGERTQEDDDIAVEEYTSVDLDILFGVRFRN